MEPNVSGVDLVRTLFSSLGAGRQLRQGTSNAVRTLFDAIGGGVKRSEEAVLGSRESRRARTDERMGPEAQDFMRVMSYADAVPDALAAWTLPTVEQEGVPEDATAAQLLLHHLTRQGGRALEAGRAGEPYEPETLDRIPPWMALTYQMGGDPTNLIPGGGAGDVAPLLGLLPYMRRALAKKLPGEGVIIDPNDPARLVPQGESFDQEMMLDWSATIGARSRMSKLTPSDPDVLQTHKASIQKALRNLNDDFSTSPFTAGDAIFYFENVGLPTDTSEEIAQALFPSATRPAHFQVEGQPAQFRGDFTEAIEYPGSPTIMERNFKPIREEVAQWVKQERGANYDMQSFDRLIRRNSGSITVHQAYDNLRGLGMPEDKARELVRKWGGPIDPIEPQARRLYHMTKAPEEFARYDLGRTGEQAGAKTHGNVIFLTDNPDPSHIESASTVTPTWTHEPPKPPSQLPQADLDQIEDAVRSQLGDNYTFDEFMDYVGNIVGGDPSAYKPGGTMYEDLKADPDAVLDLKISNFAVPDGYYPPDEFVDGRGIEEYPVGSRVRPQYIVARRPFYHAGPMPDDIWQDVGKVFEDAGFTRADVDAAMAKPRTWGYDNGYILLRNVLFGGQDAKQAMNGSKLYAGGTGTRQEEAKWANQLNDYLKAKGYDSMFHVSNEGSGGGVWMAFDPEQIINYPDFERGGLRAMQTGDLAEGTPDWDEFQKIAAAAPDESEALKRANTGRTALDDNVRQYVTQLDQDTAKMGDLQYSVGVHTPVELASLTGLPEDKALKLLESHDTYSGAAQALANAGVPQWKVLEYMDEVISQLNVNLYGGY